MPKPPTPAPVRFYRYLVARRRRWVGAVALLLLLCVYAGRDAILLGTLRRQLQRLPGVEVSLLRVHLHALLNGISIEGVQVYRPADAGRRGPAGRPLRLAEVNHLEVRWPWLGLLRGGLVCEVDVDGVDAALWRIDDTELATPVGSKKLPPEAPKRHGPPVTQTIVAAWPQIARFVLPLAIDEVTVQNARFWLHDCTTEPQVKYPFEGIALRAHNLTDRERLNKGHYATVDVSARPAGGKWNLHLELDPMAKVPTFGLRSSVSDVQLYRLNPVLKAYAKLDVEIGMFNAQVEVKSEKGRFRGFVEPRITGLRIKPRATDEAQDSVLNRLWRTSVRAATSLVENSKEEQIATRLPLTGQFVQPELGVWDAVTTLLANAYLQALQPTNLQAAGLPLLAPKAPRE